MKSKNKLGHSPLDSPQKITSQYDFISDQESDEKDNNISKSNRTSEGDTPFNINDEFKREKELRISKANSEESASLQDIPLKVLNALKDYLKL